MNNEPVAWMRPSEEGYDSAFRDHSTVKFCTGNDWDGWIPLYTHPVKEQDESFDRTASHMAGEYVSWTSCVACGQRVTGDSIHTCSPQLKQLTDEEIGQIWKDCMESPYMQISNPVGFARAILRKAQE